MKRRVQSESIAIRTFGGLTFYRGNQPIAIQWDSQKARLLFCYLLITSDQWVHRNQLIELLWPGCNHEAGFKNFKTTLSRLRKSLNSKEHFNPILAQGDAYRIKRVQASRNGDPVTVWHMCYGRGSEIPLVAPVPSVIGQTPAP